MRAPRKLAFYAFLLVSAGSCDCGDDDNNDSVFVRVREGVDFTAYHTFHIAELPNPLPVDAGAKDADIPPLVRANIAVANDQARIELQNRGLAVAAPGITADLEIASLGSASSEAGYYWECVPGYWWGYWGWVWDPCAWTVPVPVSYAVGSVMVTLSDPKLQKVVFGGVVEGVANGEGDAEERIRDGVHRMFSAYPASPK